MPRPLCSLRALLVTSLALAPLAFAARASADTIVQGGTIINQTWTAANSPYIVQGDITIPSGSTLAMDPGTLVLFAASDMQHSGDDSERVEILVSGSLIIQGSAASPVILKAQNGADPKTWYGIEVADSAAAVEIHHATIRDAFYGLMTGTFPGLVVSDSTFDNLAAEGIIGSSATITRSTFSNIAQFGLDLIGPTTLDRLTIHHVQGPGIYFAPGGTSTISNTLIHDAAIGVQVVAGYPGTVNVVNSTIHGATVGIQIYQAINFMEPAVLDVTNCIVSGSTSVGVQRDNGTLAISYSNVWGGAGSTDYQGVSPGPGCLSANPQYVDPSSDWHLASGSVCIDSGAGAGAPDHDLDDRMRPWDGDGIGGPAVDMGAYEYGAPPVGGSGGGGTGGGSTSSSSTSSSSSGMGGASSSSGTGGASSSSGMGGASSSSGMGGASSSSGTGGAGAGGQGQSSSSGGNVGESGGCGCRVPGGEVPFDLRGAISMAVACLMLARRKARR